VATCTRPTVRHVYSDRTRGELQVAKNNFFCSEGLGFIELMLIHILLGDYFLGFFICTFKSIFKSISVLSIHVYMQVRHAQGIHNVEGEKDHNAYLSYDLFDAHLSPLGWKQVIAG
jgi:hypothetical protein